MVMAKELKKYRLKRGTHRLPNPEFDPANTKASEAQPSHFVAKAGDEVELNDDQYAAFMDKFEPLEGEASEAADREKAKMEAAIKEAEEKHESVDPNIVKPVDSPSTLERARQGTVAGAAFQQQQKEVEAKAAKEAAEGGGG
jgi:hypothetical protein